MKLSIEKAELQRGLGADPGDRREAQLDADPGERAARARAQGRRRLARARGDGSRGRDPQLAPCEVAKPGALTVSARKLHEIVRELPDETVQLEATRELLPRDPLRARALHARGHLRGGVPEPAGLRVRAGSFGSMPPVLSEMIERTMYAASIDETRYNLNGVYVEVIADDGQAAHGRHRRTSPRATSTARSAATSRASRAA